MESLMIRSGLSPSNTTDPVSEATQVMRNSEHAGTANIAGAALPDGMLLPTWLVTLAQLECIRYLSDLS
jgi:hypothetical protein